MVPWSIFLLLGALIQQSPAKLIPALLSLRLLNPEIYQIEVQYISRTPKEATVTAMKSESK